MEQDMTLNGDGRAAEPPGDYGVKTTCTIS